MFNKLFYLFGLSINTFIVESQFIAGSQVDPSGHGCILDGGYQWCEEMNTCVRPWEVSCRSLMVTDPLPPTPIKDCSTCPPPAPCPRPYLPNIDMNNCRIITDRDDCGCTIGCPHYDCSNNNCNSDLDCHVDQFCRPMQTRLPSTNGRRIQSIISECVDKVGINETCGGYTLPEFQTRCLDNLECVNTMGPMIADAPGQCKEPCLREEIRDENGNCVLNNIRIPDNCLTWHDGCNTCQVRNGRADICTLMYCFQRTTPHCLTYSIQRNTLEIGDVCYRFCEDNSQETINRRNDCPQGTICKSVFSDHSNSMISYDSCDDRASTCLLINH